MPNNEVKVTRCFILQTMQVKFLTYILVIPRQAVLGGREGESGAEGNHAPSCSILNADRFPIKQSSKGTSGRRRHPGTCIDDVGTISNIVLSISNCPEIVPTDLSKNEGKENCVSAVAVERRNARTKV